MREIGFFDTPDKFAAALQSLDAAIGKLSEAIKTSPNVGGINTAWRTEYAKFVRRWELERDQYGPWMARLMLMEPNRRLQLFKDHYQWWADDFEKKSKSTIPSKESTGFETAAEAVIPDQVWWIVGGAVVLFVLVKL